MSIGHAHLFLIFVEIRVCYLLKKTSCFWCGFELGFSSAVDRAYQKGILRDQMGIHL